MGEHLEEVAALAPAEQLGEVAAHGRLGGVPQRWSSPVSRPPSRDECSEPRIRSTGGAHGGGDAGARQVRLTGLDAGQDAQLGEAFADLVQLGEVAVHVERRPRDRAGRPAVAGRAVAVDPVGEIQVLGERDGREALRDRPLAGLRIVELGRCPTTTGCARGCPAVSSPLWDCLTVVHSLPAPDGGRTVAHPAYCRRHDHRRGPTSEVASSVHAPRRWPSSANSPAGPMRSSARVRTWRSPRWSSAPSGPSSCRARAWGSQRSTSCRRPCSAAGATARPCW